MFARSAHLSSGRKTCVMFICLDFIFPPPALWNVLHFGTYKEVTHQPPNSRSFYLKRRNAALSPDFQDRSFLIGWFGQKLRVRFLGSLLALFASLP